MYCLTVQWNPAPAEIRCPEDGVTELRYRLFGEAPALEIQFPFVDCMGLWHPLCGCSRSHDADWAEPVATMTSKSAPVLSVFSEDSRNRCTVALSETRELVRISAGIHEEDGMFRIRAVLPSPEDGAAGRDVTVWIDTRDIPFAQALRGVTDWWENRCGLTPMAVPETARRPMYSSWYSYHQMIQADTLEQECALAKELGFHSIIVDDGWQTGDSNRGYAYCGDWTVCPQKIPDMAAHVARVHRLGLRYLLWFSVPFVGKKSRNWQRFRDKILHYDEELQAGVLDPRYPDVREFLVETYRSALEQYGLDGLKLDFIDQFVEKNGPVPANDRMDIPGLQDAVDVLMQTVSRTLQRINPEVMLEFRQFYIGPNIRRYGNLFRVDDCPNSALRNRVGIVDLRLLCGHSAVHSDMLMWHPEEAPEEIAIQMISCLFGTVQVSVLLEKLTERQRRTVAFWTRFMDENRRLLLEPVPEVLEPHNLYPEISVETDSERLTALYTAKRVVTFRPGKSCTIVNGTKAQAVFLRITVPVKLRLTVRDCTGEAVNRAEWNREPGMYEIPVPAGGLIQMEK